MITNRHVVPWVSLQGLPVLTLSDGIKVGTVEDFYLDAESNEVRGFKVNYGIFGYRALLSEFIREIRSDVVVTDNPQMLIDPAHDGRLPIMILGNTLRSYTLMSESGQTIGTVADTILDTYPPIALRVTGFVVSNTRAVVPAHAVTAYDTNVIYILDKVARRYV
jgi:sporulation protein YlmC with PRC-barrel domain